MHITRPKSTVLAYAHILPGVRLQAFSKKLDPDRAKKSMGRTS